MPGDRRRQRLRREQDQQAVGPQALRADTASPLLYLARPEVAGPVHSPLVAEFLGETHGVRPDDIAPMVVYLASPAAEWITGQCYDIDGNASADLIPKAIPDL